MFCVVLTVLTLSACASNSSDSVSESEDGVTLPPADGGSIPIPPAENAATDVKPDGADAVAAAPVPATIGEETQPAPTAPAEAAPVATKTKSADQSKSGSFEYSVKPGQTLMQVAYDVYGDIYKWKHVLEMNQDKIKNPTALSPGLVLMVDQNPKENISNTDGTPYLIKHGDTLVLISDDVYGTTRKWQKIWNNNKKLIRDPNKIYAGFYLYYLFNEQDRIEKEQFKGLQKPAMLQASPTVERDVSSVPAQPAAQ